jgi:hypothetical protein
MAESPQNKLRLKDLLILLGVILANAVIIGILVRGFLSAD